MSRLSLAVLGLPEVRLQGQALTFRTRKALALFIYLAIEGGPERQRRSHSREKLTLFFWPESDSTRGRMMLRTTLAHLRQALAQAADYVLVERDSLSFNFNSDYELDLDVVEVAARAVRDTATVDDLRECFLNHFVANFSIRRMLAM